MAERRVRERREHLDAHLGRATDGELAFAVADGHALATHHEGVGDGERPWRAQRGGGTRRRGSEDIVMRAPTAALASLGRLSRWGRRSLLGSSGFERRLEVRQEHQVERAIGEREREHFARTPVPATHEEARLLDEHVVGRDTLGPVVVAGDEGDVRPGATQSQQRVAQQVDRPGRRQRPVEQIARHHHQVDLLGGNHLGQPVDERGLVLLQRDRPEGPAEMPVAGVEDAHGVQPTEGV